jgi:hypothetical protein
VLIEYVKELRAEKNCHPAVLIEYVKELRAKKNAQINPSTLLRTSLG